MTVDKVPAAADVDVATNLAEVEGTIAAAANAAGRNPREIALVAVSKTQPVDAILSGIRAGQCRFGENRVQ